MHPLDRAVKALQAGRAAEAESLCRIQVLADPRDFDAWRVLAFALDALGRPEESLQACERALALRPDDAETAFNRANGLQRLKRHDEAVAAYDRALAADPAFSAAWFNRANALQALGRREAAAESYDRAIALKPDFVEAHYNRAIAHAFSQRHAEALEGFTRVLALRPGYGEAHRRRASALNALARPAEALEALNAALAQRPEDVEAWNSLGMALRALGRHDEAMAAYDRALALQPDHVHVRANRGNILHEQKRYEEALAAYEAALAADPGQPRAFGGAADCVIKLCDWKRGARYGAELPGRIADTASVIAPLIPLGYSDDAALHQACARKYVAAEFPRLPAPLWTGGARRPGKLRIAYLSSDFREHPVARLMAPLLEAHDRGRFEIIGVAFGADEPDPMTARIAAACDAFHDIRALDNAAAARLLFEAGVDIAVDLTGHTYNARPGILAHRPAPVQASYLGFPATQGAGFIDYVLADSTVAPMADQPVWDEAIVHLPLTYWPGDGSEPADEETPSRTEAGLPETGFVFASFNTMWKITPQVFDVWMRLLAAVPGSVLWLHRDNLTAEANLKREAAQRGVDPERLVFKTRVAAGRHMALHRLADLFLDTLPYNAHATASDALAAGLPILTCRGKTFAGRVGASLLGAIGLDDLIAEDLAAYEKLALALTNDPGRLTALRQRLAKARNAPLFSGSRAARGLEAAYEIMAGRVQSRLPPQGFSVE